MHLFTKKELCVFGAEGFSLNSSRLFQFWFIQSFWRFRSSETGFCQNRNQSCMLSIWFANTHPETFSKYLQYWPFCRILEQFFRRYLVNYSCKFWLFPSLAKLVFLTAPIVIFWVASHCYHLSWSPKSNLCNYQITKTER